ncbi:MULTISPECIES: hypothetical protein [unclassified Candidatus Tisiphia]|jgi:hypothetical protein
MNYLLVSYLFAFLALGLLLVTSWLGYKKIKVRLVNAKKGEK